MQILTQIPIMQINVPKAIYKSDSNENSWNSFRIIPPVNRLPTMTKLQQAGTTLSQEQIEIAWFNLMMLQNMLQMIRIESTAIKGIGSYSSLVVPRPLSTSISSFIKVVERPEQRPLRIAQMTSSLFYLKFRHMMSTFLIDRMRSALKN